MNENLCCYKRLQVELGITEQKARGYMKEYEKFEGANVTTSRMSEIVDDLIDKGLEKKPIRKPGRPVVVKEGCTGKRMNKTITMDLEIDRIIEKHATGQSASGVIEDAVILFDKVAEAGVAPGEVVGTLAEASTSRLLLAKCKELLQAIYDDKCPDAMLQIGYLMQDMEALVK